MVPPVIVSSAAVALEVKISDIMFSPRFFRLLSKIVILVDPVALVSLDSPMTTMPLQL